MKPPTAASPFGSKPVVIIFPRGDYTIKLRLSTSKKVRRRWTWEVLDRSQMIEFESGDSWTSDDALFVADHVVRELEKGERK